MDITKFYTGGGRGGEAGGVAPRVYHGNAEPEGQVVVIGGRDVVVGGWVVYEAARRRARWDAAPHSRTAAPSSRYRGRTRITGQDVLESLVTARTAVEGGGGAGEPADPLARAAGRLAGAVDAFGAAVRGGAGAESAWARLALDPDAPLAVSTLSAADVREVVAETDPAELFEAAAAAAALAAAYARPGELAALRPPPPPARLPRLPAGEVAVGGGLAGAAAEGADRAVARLEAAAVPRAAAVEAYRGSVAAALDASAAVLERAAAA